MKKVMFCIYLIPMYVFAYADMDYTCSVFIKYMDARNYSVDEYQSESKQIYSQIQEKGCKRNNILNVIHLNEAKQTKQWVGDWLRSFSSEWCRFDREIIFTDTSLYCVLYSTSGRSPIIFKKT